MSKCILYDMASITDLATSLADTFILDTTNELKSDSPSRG
jgi:hypothetical protein